MKDRETLLEIGFVVLGLGLLAGIGSLLLGQAGGGIKKNARRAQPAPERGSVPPQRHQHVSAVAAR